MWRSRKVGECSGFWFSDWGIHGATQETLDLNSPAQSNPNLCFLETAQQAPTPRGHTPISQIGSIATEYILL